MPISLSKGQKISLEKEAPGLKKVLIGLGWDVKHANTGVDFDLDASVLILGENEKIISDSHFIFYNNLKSPDGSIEHTGDNRTGAGEGDDEAIKVNFEKVSAQIKKMIFVVTIHQAKERKQNFGQVQNAYVRLVNEENGQVVAKYDLSEDYSSETALIMCELYRHNTDWKLAAVGSGYNEGLDAILRRYYDGEIS